MEKRFDRITYYVSAVTCWVFLLAGCNTNQISDDASPAVTSQTKQSDESARAALHAQLAALYLQDGNLAVAMEEARIAIESDPSYAPAYNVTALTHMQLGEKEKAEENFKKALNIAPGDPETSNNYGWFLCQNERAQESLPYLLRAARNPLYQTPDRAYLNAGVCSLHIKDYPAAEDYLQRALGLARNNPTALLGLAMAYHYNGNYTAADRTLRELNQIVDLNAEALWLQLRVSRRLGDKVGENIAASQLRRKYKDSAEYQAYVDGKFD